MIVVEGRQRARPGDNLPAWARAIWLVAWLAAFTPVGFVAVVGVTLALWAVTLLRRVYWHVRLRRALR
jgi:hypothetical protein